MHKFGLLRKQKAALPALFARLYLTGIHKKGGFRKNKMKKIPIISAAVSIFLSTAILLSGCDFSAADNDPEKEDTAETSCESSNTGEEENFVALFGADETYSVLKTDVEGNFSSTVQDFLSDLRSKVGKKDIFASADYTKETEKEILIGYIDEREESVAKMVEISFDSYYIGFSGEKLLVCAYTAEQIEEALDRLIEALYRSESGAWGLDKDFTAYGDKDGKDVRAPEFESDAARLVGAYVSNGDRNQLACKDATLDDYNAYNQKLTDNGYTQYSQNQIGENRYATYVNDTTEIHLIYYPSLSNFRIVFGTRGYLPATETPEYEKVTDCKVTQIGRKGATASASGESYVIQLEDGSFIVIDGGPNNSYDVESLLAFLKENKPESHAKPKVMWMFTHLHGDHTTLAINFLINKCYDIELTAICYNFPNVDTALNDTNCATLYTNIMSAKIKNPDAETYVFHSGQRMMLPGCEIEFLYTQEDHWPTGFNTANDTSAVWRMKFEGGDFLVLGDSESTPCRQITKIYGNYLESDILQLSHHGMNGATMEIYEAIDPKICFWAIDEERFSTDPRCLGDQKNFEFNKYVRTTEWTRGETSGEREHYSASRTVTINMSDMSITVGEWLT